MCFWKSVWNTQYLRAATFTFEWDRNTHTHWFWRENRVADATQKKVFHSLPVDIGETVGVVRADCDLHHNAGTVVDHCCQFLPFGTRDKHSHDLVTWAHKKNIITFQQLIANGIFNVQHFGVCERERFLLSRKSDNSGQESGTDLLFWQRTKTFLYIQYIISNQYSYLLGGRCRGDGQAQNFFKVINLITIYAVRTCRAREFFKRFVDLLSCQFFLGK